MRLGPAILAALVVGALALASDVNTGTVSSYSQPVGVRDNATGKVHPMSGSDGGVPNVRVQSGTVIATGSDGGRPQVDVNSGTLISTGPDGGAVVLKPAYVITPASVQCMTCPAAGSNSYKVTQDCAEFSVQSETVYECGALTCVNDGGTVGVPYLVGSRGPRCWNQSATGGADGGASGDKSCWSTSGTGRICWVPIANP